MKKGLGLLKGFTSLAICGMIFGASGGLVSAKENAKQSMKEGVAVSAFYINDKGERVDIPKEDMPELLDEKAVYELPGDTKVKKEKDSGISPDANVCPEGWVYAGSRSTAGFKSHKTGTKQANKTSKVVTFSSTTSQSFKISPELSVTSGVSWGVINGQVGFKMSAEWSWTSTESVTISIPPNRMAWNDFGSYRESWSGPYYYRSTSCTQSSTKTVRATGSKYKMNVSRKSAIPSGV